MVSRLHAELGHSDPGGMIDCLRRKHAHRLVIATAKKFRCRACEESQRRRLHPVAVRVLHEPGSCFQFGQFCSSVGLSRGGVVGFNDVRKVLTQLSV